MMSTQTIMDMAKEAGKTVRACGWEPYFIEYESEKDCWPPFPFPNLGSYRPKGWKLMDNFMADSSGFGSEDEPALTFSQLRKRVRVGYGYGIIECGQFQVVIGEFRKVKGRR